MFKNIVAILLISVGLFSEPLVEYATDPGYKADVLQIKRPTSKAISASSKINNIVTEESDRVKLAIFNYHFATNIISYDTTVQKAVSYTHLTLPTTPYV